MRSFKTGEELDLLVVGIQETSNECLAELALNVEPGLTSSQRSSLVDVIILSKNQVRAISVLDRNSDFSPDQKRALQIIAR